MRRIRQFMSVGGWLFIAQLLFGVGLLIWLLHGMSPLVQVIVAALMAIGFVIPYAFRGVLVRNMRAMRRVLNLFIISLLLFVWLVVPRLPSNVQMIVIASPLLVGMHIGCWFWMLSDPRLVRMGRMVAYVAPSPRSESPTPTAAHPWYERTR